VIPQKSSTVSPSDNDTRDDPDGEKQSANCSRLLPADLRTGGHAHAPAVLSRRPTLRWLH